MEQDKENISPAKICVVIPVYNNRQSIKEVLESALDDSWDVLAVNDGSTDDTGDFLRQYKDILQIHYFPNKGKGQALQRAFKKAFELGYTHAVAMDGDGQHSAKDLPAFAEAIKQYPKSIIIGARKFEGENVPGGSSFGRKFSNFWFRIETGIKLSDTQSGFRAYPLETMQKYHWFTNRYEFEIENIVRFAWRGGNIREIPISVHYPKPEERISHFRPFKDFFRISILNTVLVLLAFLYGLPRRAYHVLRRYSFKEFWKKYISGANDSNLKLSQSIGIGIFMGIIPLWGWQTILALSAAHFLKLNKAFTILAANISLPPMMPIILFGSFYAGALVMNNPLSLSFENGISLETVSKDLLQYAVGSIVLAFVGGLFAFVVSWLLLKLFRKDRNPVI